MKSFMLRERGEWESDIARSWWQLPPHTLLSLEDGQRCLLLYHGQPGGSAGPDVRDAVLRFLPPPNQHTERTISSRDSSPEPALNPAPPSLLEAAERASDSEGRIVMPSLVPFTPPDDAMQVPDNKTGSEVDSAGYYSETEQQLVGDVEFHTYASDWFAHHHQSDPRYNRVILHVVLVLDSRLPTRRQDGAFIPTCSLHDLLKIPEQVASWPCQQHPLPADQLTATLVYAGLLRFHEKSHVLRQALSATQPRPGASFDNYDSCLLPALAEGLAYGRDRAFFRAVGLRLVGLPTRIPEPLGHTPTPAPLDARRLRILYTLCARWRRTGAWRTFEHILQAEQDVKETLAALRAALYPLSRARTDILICNVVLPFAAAVADVAQNPRLATRAYQCYLAYPGLVSNRVTRMMSAQLQLPAEPAQASLQQGLHYIYAHTCQAKRCQVCVCGGERL